MRVFKICITIVAIAFLAVAPSLSQTQSASSTIQISATVGSTPPGGGGGGNPPIGMPTIVNFSGLAYPASRVIILNGTEIAVRTVADPEARFSASLTDLNAGSYIFTVYAEDKDGRKSLFYTFPITLTSGTTVNIGGIFLSPTLDIDKTQVRAGDDILFFGHSVPNATINITVNSATEHVKTVGTDSSGRYSYKFNTTPLELGSHEAKSVTITETSMSPYSNPVHFTVGDENIENIPECGKLRGDLNCDNKVNLVDFSIMAYWYKRSGWPVRVDLNKDGKIMLTDFSIMAYNWTG